MAAISEKRLTPERVRLVLTEWFAQRHSPAVVFKESTDPKVDKYADYLVAYEATFEPLSLHQARVELWVTINGSVGVGLERWSRISARLGKKCTRDRFAAGFEPQYIDEADLLMILDLIAGGNVAIATTFVPLFGLISTKAVVSLDTFRNLVSQGCHACSWLKPASQHALTRKGCIIHFLPWIINISAPNPIYVGR